MRQTTTKMISQEYSRLAVRVSMGPKEALAEVIRSTEEYQCMVGRLRNTKLVRRLWLLIRCMQLRLLLRIEVSTKFQASKPHSGELIKNQGTVVVEVEVLTLTIKQ